MSRRQRSEVAGGTGPRRAKASAPRTRGVVTPLGLEAAYVPATASRVAIVEDSLQVLAVLALRAARAAKEGP